MRADYLFGESVRRGHVRVVQEAERNWNFREQKWEIKGEPPPMKETQTTKGAIWPEVDLFPLLQDELRKNDYERFSRYLLCRVLHGSLHWQDGRAAI